MNINSIKRGLCFLLLASSFLACNKIDDDSVFEKNPTERLAAQKKELSEALLSSDYGWKVVYFTDEKSFGGFTFLFKFDDQGKVITASDFTDADITPETTEYDIQLRATTSLVFTTKNKIHVLSDGANSPLESGRGYKGDVQFGYYGRENDDILFKTSRSNKNFRLVKATAEDWNNLGKNREMLLNIASLSKPLFQSLEVTSNGETKAYEFEFSGVTRFATVKNSDLQPINEGEGVGVGFTQTGITLFPAIVVGGEEVFNLDYNATLDQFIGTNSANDKVVVKYLATPFKGTVDAAYLFDSNSQVGFHADRLTYAPATSPMFSDAIEAIQEELKVSGNELDRIIFVFGGNSSIIVYRFVGGLGEIRHNVRVTKSSTGSLIFTSGTWTGPTAPASLRALDDKFMDPKGLFVRKESYNVGFINDLYTFSTGSVPVRFSTYLYN